MSRETQRPRPTLVSSELTIHPELEVTLADYTWLPARFSSIFQATLEKDDGLALIHFAAEVERCTWGTTGSSGAEMSPVVQKKVIVLSRNALYLCNERSDIGRCVPLELIEEVFIMDDWICLGVPTQYDLLFRISTNNLNTHAHQSFFLETLNALRLKLLGPHHQHPMLTPVSLPTFDAVLRRPLSRSQGQGVESKPVPIPIVPWAELVTFPRCDVIIRSLSAANAEKCAGFSPAHQRQHRDAEMAGLLQAKNQPQRSARSRGRNEPNYEEDEGYSSPTSPTGRRRYATLKAINEVLEKDISAASKWKNINDALNDKDSPIRKRENGRFDNSPKRRIQAAVPRRKDPLDNAPPSPSPIRQRPSPSRDSAPKLQTSSTYVKQRDPNQGRDQAISSASELRNYDFNEELAPIPLKYPSKVSPSATENKKVDHDTFRPAVPPQHYELSSRTQRPSQGRAIHEDSPLPYALRQEGIVSHQHYGDHSSGRTLSPRRKSPEKNNLDFVGASRKNESREPTQNNHSPGGRSDQPKNSEKMDLVWEELLSQRQTLEALSKQMHTLMSQQQQILSREAAAVIHGDRVEEEKWEQVVAKGSKGGALASDASASPTPQTKAGIREKNERKPSPKPKDAHTTSSLTPFQRKLVGRSLYGGEGQQQQLHGGSRNQLQDQSFSTEYQHHKLEEGWNSPTEPKVRSNPSPAVSEGQLHRRVASPYQIRKNRPLRGGGIGDGADGKDLNPDHSYWSSSYLQQKQEEPETLSDPPRPPAVSALAKQPHHLTGTRTTRAQEMRSLHNQATYGLNTDGGGSKTAEMLQPHSRRL